MAMSRIRNMQDLKVPMKRFALNASDSSVLLPLPEAFKAPDRTTDRNPPRSGRPAPALRKDPADSEFRKPPSSKGGEYGDESKGKLRTLGPKGTPEQARKLASALGGRRQQP